MVANDINFSNWYDTCGFSENPFGVHALRADELGRRLMVGRDEQVTLVAQRLLKDGKITCLDGHVGVGKSSLVNVAAFECFRAFFDGKCPQLLIPLSESFQLIKNEDTDVFCEKVFRKIATGLLQHRNELQSYDFPKNAVQNLNSWLNSPIIEFVNDTVGASVTGGIPGFINASIKRDDTVTRQTNTGAGFAKEGLEQLVRCWLSEIFVKQGSGGVVCVIDNLELLESAVNARRMLEALRDRLFNINGLRWVFCGADGVIHSLAASPRLGSFLNTPIIDLRNIGSTHIEPLIRARIEEFSDDSATAEQDLPIRIQDVVALYPIINFNLRDLLHYADDYCDHQFQLGKQAISASEKSTRFLKWLERLTSESYATLSSRVHTSAWVVLDMAMCDTFKGTFGVGDFGTFNSNSKTGITKPSFDKYLKEFLKLGLITENINDHDNDEEGGRRDVFTVTAKGALVHYARLIKQESQSLIPSDWLRRVHLPI